MLMWAPATGHHQTQRRACAPGAPRLRRAVFDGRGGLGRQQSRILLRVLFLQLKAGWETLREETEYMWSHHGDLCILTFSSLSTAQEQHISPQLSERAYNLLSTILILMYPPGC